MLARFGTRARTAWRSRCASWATSRAMFILDWPRNVELRRCVPDRAMPADAMRVDRDAVAPSSLQVVQQAVRAQWALQFGQKGSPIGKREPRL